MQLSRIRKAIVGGVAAGVSAVASSFVFTGAPTQDQISKMLGAFLVAAVLGGYAVYKAPKNAPAANDTKPPVGAPDEDIKLTGPHYLP